MSQRESNLVWLRDIVEHLASAQQRLEWTDDPETTRLVTEQMLRDLERCRRLCEMMHRRSASLQEAV